MTTTATTARSKIRMLNTTIAALLLMLALLAATNVRAQDEVLVPDACGDLVNDYVPVFNGQITEDGLLFDAYTPTGNDYAVVTLNFPTCASNFVDRWTVIATNTTRCTYSWQLPVTYNDLSACVVKDPIFDSYIGEVGIELIKTQTVDNPAGTGQLQFNTTRKFAYPFRFTIQRVIEIVEVSSNSTFDVFASIADLRVSALLSQQQFIKTTRVARLTMIVLYNSNYRLTAPSIAETQFGRNVTIPQTLATEDCLSIPGTCSATYIINVALGEADCFFSGKYNITFTTLLFPELSNLNSPTTVSLSVASEDVCAVKTDAVTAQATMTPYKGSSTSSSASFALGDTMTWVFSVTSSRYIRTLTISDFWICRVPSGTTSSLNCFTLPINDSSIVYIVAPAYSVNFLSASSQNLTVIPAIARISYVVSRALLTSRDPTALQGISTTNPVTYRASARLNVEYGAIYSPKAYIPGVGYVVDNNGKTTLSNKLKPLALAAAPTSDSFTSGASFMFASESAVATPSISSKIYSAASSTSINAGLVLLQVLIVLATALFMTQQQ